MKVSIKGQREQEKEEGEEVEAVEAEQRAREIENRKISFSFAVVMAAMR